MESDAVTLIMSLAAILAAIVIKRRKYSGNGCCSYESNMTLFTPAERTFLGVIESVLENSNYRVFGKVRLGDLVKPKDGMGKNKYATAHDKIDGKHVHFAVCRRDDLSVIAAIEFEEKSDEKCSQESSKEADNFFTSVKIPHLHITAQKGYALSDIKQKLSTVGVEVGRCMSITEQVQSRTWTQLMPATRSNQSYICRVGSHD